MLDSGGIETKAIVDSGSALSFLSSETVQRFAPDLLEGLVPMLMFGRDFRVPLELVLPVPEEDTTLEASGVEHYVEHWGGTLECL